MNPDSSIKMSIPPPSRFVISPEKLCNSSNAGDLRTKSDHCYANGKSNIFTYTPGKRRNSAVILFAHRDMYAGAKFSDHPSPAQLPKPPRHWVHSCGSTSTPKHCSRQENPPDISNHNAMALKIKM